MEVEPARRLVFEQLQPLCSCLLQHRNDVRELSKALNDLSSLLCTLNVEGLRGCSSYVLFPLLFIVDSTYASRNKAGDHSEAPAAPVPAAKSDKVAELALSCCKTLLERCPGQTEECKLELLQRIGAVAALSRTAASEEVRHAALECLAALLAGVPGGNPAAAEVLRAKASTPLVAATAMMLQKAANAEANAGLHGSKAVRLSALRALRLLYEAVNDAQALSYVLPGAVGGLSKALLQGSAMTRHGTRAQSGAAASTTATVEALAGLFSVIRITLSDDSTADARSSPASAQTGAGSVQNSSEALIALRGLQRLAVALPDQPSQEAQKPQEKPLPSRHDAPNTQAQNKYRVNRDAAWLENTVTHLERLLRRVLPPLCSSRHPKVRQALAEGVCELLVCCRHALAPCSELLLELAFTLAADSWPAVAAAPRAWLARVQREGSLDGHLPQASTERFIGRLLRQLLPAVRSMEGDGPALANRLAATMQVADVQLVATQECYEAVAGVARTAGRVASLAGGTVLRGLLDRLISDLQLEAIVVMVQEEWVREPLWGVPTSAEPSHGDAGPSLTPQVLAENALLARALLEGVGAFGRALGRRYAAGGRLMFTVLIPALERLADPCPSVASAASAAVASICLHCGYTGLEELVQANADYIVDGLCRQLRHLDNHPRAPYLFAGLLLRAGVAPALLPLLAEPARAAVQGLAITARRKRPAHIAAFLAALREICCGARSDAATVLAAIEETACAVEKESAARREAYCERTAEAEREFERGKSEEEVQRYFMQHLEQKQQEDEGEAALDHVDEEDEAAQVPWSAEAWALANERLRRAHANAALAHSAALMAGPLLTSPDLRVLLLAMDVARSALQTLQHTSALLDIYEYRIKMSVQKKTSVEPVPPETPQLLPTVHALWSPLVQSLKDARVAAVEHALDFLADYTDVGGGDFLARRFAQEAWPQLALLLHRGPDTALGSDDGGPAPAVVQRTRAAVFACLLRIASSSRSAPVLSQIIAKVADAVGGHVADRAGSAERTVASQLLLSLAKLDADAVWLLLFRMQGPMPGGRQVPNPCPAVLPDLVTPDEQGFA
ncbi:hypothetical protein WJX75_006066 [Coccomyxa subellipsoidea]|uniref:ARM repeat-containing protein n=1 Tax=Coccomyxa subellipsoidea TaxID=248742 RepID=A0ABR2YVV4_9CHLO